MNGKLSGHQHIVSSSTQESVDHAVVTLQDGSHIALATVSSNSDVYPNHTHGQYLGGSIGLFPIATDGNDIHLLDTSPVELLPEFPYSDIGFGPVKSRQGQCHIHQVLEDSRGLLYAPDLGSDRIWITERNELQLDICGWLACPPGTGPRHAVISHDGKCLWSHSI